MHHRLLEAHIRVNHRIHIAIVIIINNGMEIAKKRMMPWPRHPSTQPNIAAWTVNCKSQALKWRTHKSYGFGDVAAAMAAYGTKIFRLLAVRYCACECMYSSAYSWWIFM